MTGKPSRGRSAAVEITDVHLRSLHLPARFARRIEDRTGLTEVQASALLAVRDGAHRLTDVAERTRQHVSGASRTIDGLVSSGLVDRTVDEDDRRAIRLALTPEGKRAVDGVVEIYVETIDEILVEMPAEQAGRMPELMAAYMDAADRVLRD